MRQVQVTVSNEEIGRRLRLVKVVVTPAQGVRNDLVDFDGVGVTVRSARTQRERLIPYDDIRNWRNVNTNGVIVRVLAEVLGLTGVEDEATIDVGADEVHAPASLDEQLANFYREAKVWVKASSDWDIDEARERDPSKLTPAGFLSHYAWAVYASGFRARTVRTYWTRLEAAWRGFDPAKVNGAARDAALALIAHQNKCNAIFHVAELLKDTPWEQFRAKYLVNAEAMGALPWTHRAHPVGPVCDQSFSET